MRPPAWLILASSCGVIANQHVFSVHDDLLAFPQYEVIFSDTFILDSDADRRIAAAASSTAGAKSDPGTPLDGAGEVSHATSEHGEGGNGDGDDRQHNGYDDSAPQSYEEMILGGRRYLCSIPTVSAPDSSNETTEAAARAEHEKELARASDRGWELLKEMEGHCMFFMSGWWSYSFCYNDEVKQFHQLPPHKGAPLYPPLEDPNTPSYILGRVRAKRDNLAGNEGQHDEKEGSIGMGSSTELQAKGETRYLVQRLAGGSTCDLTGKERRIEVQFHCHPQSSDRIGWIKEVSTCSYLMVIYTPRLCNDVAFLSPRENRANPIACREVLSPPEVAEWKTRKASEMENQMIRAAEDKVMVGGVELGGMQDVGSEGRRIEGSAAVGGGAYVESAGIVASSEGRARGGRVSRLSNEELKKLNLDPETIEELRKELEELAGEHGWKLEVVNTGDGNREMRGIVDTGDDDGEEDEEDGHYEGGSEEGYQEEGYQEEL